MDIPKLSKRFETSLASSLSAAGTSFTTISATDDDGNALSGLYALSIDVGNADVEDVIATVSATTWTIVYRGIDADAPNTEVTANKKAHRRGAPVVITDYPLVAVLRNILNGEATLPNKLQYASHPSISGNQDIPDKQYVDSLANTGAADATTTVQGLVEEPTQAEVEAGTGAGGTGAKLFIPGDRNGARLFFGYAADAGANDTYAITCSPVPTAYTTGMLIQFKANTANTGACTINVNTLGAKSLKVHKDLDPQDGYIKAGQDVLIQYDGTNFQVLSVSGKPSISQSGEEIYAASSAGSDTYAVTLAPVPAAYTTGMVVRFKADVANTGAATLNVNGLGAKSILRPDGSALADADIAANQFVQVIYDGTSMLLQSPTANSPKFNAGTTSKNAADASTTQTIAHALGRTPRKVRITAVSAGVANGWTGVAQTVYVGTTQSSVSTYNTGVGTATQAATFTLNTDPSAGTQSGVITTDATNITITWTKTNSPTGTYQLLWEVEA